MVARSPSGLTTTWGCRRRAAAGLRGHCFDPGAATKQSASVASALAFWDGSGGAGCLELALRTGLQQREVASYPIRQPVLVQDRLDDLEAGSVSRETPALLRLPLPPNFQHRCSRNLQLWNARADFGQRVLGQRHPLAPSSPVAGSTDGGRDAADELPGALVPATAKTEFYEHVAGLLTLGGKRDSYLLETGPTDEVPEMRHAGRFP